MAIRRTTALVGTAEEFAAVTGIFPDGQLLIDLTANTIRLGDGLSPYADLPVIGTPDFGGVIDGGGP